MYNKKKTLQYRKDRLSDRLRDLKREENEILAELHKINKELSNMQKVA